MKFVFHRQEGHPPASVHARRKKEGKLDAISAAKRRLPLLLA
jgi:hypothetical protein